jgi:dolichyl-phosphate beta-glucosyltransferase
MGMRALKHPNSKMGKTVPDLTLIIPAYNEVTRLPATLAAVKQELDHLFLDYRVVVVDDGSRDGTWKVVDRFGARFSCLRLPGNSGKGSAVRAGMLQATGRVVAFTDADLPFDLKALHEGYTRIEESQCDVVCGDRTAHLESEHASSSQTISRRLSGFVFRRLVRMIVAPQIEDTQCGLKIFSRRAAWEIFRKIEATGFAFDVEVICRAQRLGFELGTIPVQLVNSAGSTISLWRHTWPMFQELLAIRRRLKSMPTSRMLASRGYRFHQRQAA